MKIRTVLLSLVAVSLCSVALARSPFDGTWSIDNSKSQLAGGTMTFQDAGNGTLKYTDSEQSYTFKPDGSSFRTLLGVETFQKTSDSHYTVTTKTNGLLLTTETWKLSPDGNTLTIESRGTRPDGKNFDNYETDVRTSAGTGIVGSWKSTKVKVTAPNTTLTIRTSGRNDLTLTISAIKATIQGKWDGAGYPVRGPTQPSGATAALTRVGNRGFEVVYKVNGKVLQIMHFTVAADGKSMAVEGTNGDGKEPARQVWDKRS